MLRTDRSGDHIFPQKELEMKTVKRALKTSCIFAAAWCLSGLATPAAWAQVLDQVPSDATVVFKINHLDATNTKVSSLLQSLGVTDLVPTMKDPLTALETQLGIGPGLEPKRDAAAVMLNGNLDGGGPPPFVMLLPVFRLQGLSRFGEGRSHRR